MHRLRIPLVALLAALLAIVAAVLTAAPASARTLPPDFTVTTDRPTLDDLDSIIEFLVATPASDEAKAANVEGGMAAVVVPKTVYALGLFRAPRGWHQVTDPLVQRGDSVTATLHSGSAGRPTIRTTIEFKKLDGNWKLSADSLCRGGADRRAEHLLQRVIEIDDLSVRLGGRTVLDRVTTTVPDGTLVYLLGRNGAGKTTLLRAASGIVTPAAGRVRVDGRSPRDRARPLAEIGVHLGTGGFHPGHTARRHLRWLARAGGIDRRRVDEMLDAVGLTAVAGRRCTDLSTGMRQRLGIAAALLGDARTIVLDEPANGLDIDGIRWLRGLLRDLAGTGRALLVASHLFDEVARTGDRVLVLDAGRLVADAPVAEFVGAHDTLEDAYLAVVPAVDPGVSG